MGNSTPPSEKHLLPARLAVTFEGNYFAARMDFRALQNNILQLFAKNTRRFFKDFLWNPMSVKLKPEMSEKTQIRVF